MGTSRRDKTQTVKFRAAVDTYQGKLIQYLQNHPSGAQKLVVDLVESICMPFVLDSSEEQERDLACQYIEKASSYVRAARFRWQLPEVQIGSGALPSISYLTPGSNGSIELESQPEFSSELESASLSESESESSAALEEEKSEPELVEALEEEEELDEQEDDQQEDYDSEEWQRIRQNQLDMDRTIGFA